VDSSDTRRLSRTYQPLQSQTSLQVSLRRILRVEQTLPHPEIQKSKRHQIATSPQHKPRRGPSKVYGKRRRTANPSTTSASFASLALHPYSWRDMTVLDGQKATQLRHDFGRQLRSSSPAVKRPASDMEAQDREEHTSDVDMDRGSSPPTISVTGGVDDSGAPETTSKAKQQDTGVRHERQPSVDMLSSNPKAASQAAPSGELASNANLSGSISPTVSYNVLNSGTSIDRESSPKDLQ
jgi:hypothetical protein